MSGARVAAVLLGLTLVPVLVLLAGGVAHALRRAHRRPARGVELPRAENPRLWEEVDAVAAGLGVTPPSRLLVDLQVDVALRPVGGHRELRIGLPLLAATSRVQLRALLAHELAHDDGHSWPAALARRTQQAAATAVAALPDPAARRLLARLLGPYVALAERITTDRTLAADGHAARVVGSQAAASSLRRLAELARAWEVLHREYVPLAVAADRRPSLVHGLHSVLSARAAALEDAAARSAPASRLQALLAVPVLVPAEADGDTAACTLLDGGFGRLEQLEADLHASALPSAPWSEVAARAGLARCAESSAALARIVGRGDAPAPVTLRAVLDAVGRAAGGPLVAWHLPAAVSHALCLSGAYVHRLDWTGPSRLTSATDPEQGVDVHGLMAHVLADPTSVPELCRLLERHGAALDVDLDTVGAGATVVEGLATALLGQDRRRYDLLACSTGVLVLPAPARLQLPQLGRGRGARAEQVEQQRVAALLAAGLPALRAVPGARWVGTHDVLAGRLHRRRAGWVLEVRVRLGLPMELRSTGRTRLHGTPLETALSVLADRAGERAWQASTLGLPVPA